jgi:hypothetical protein
MRENPPSKRGGQLDPARSAIIRKKKDVVAILTLPCYHLQHGHTVSPKKRNAASGTADISQDQRRLRLFSGPLRPEFQDFCGADEIGG